MIQRIEAKEQIIKKVVEFGTGGIVYAPKRWLGQEVIVVLPKPFGGLKERVFKILEPNLEHVIGIYFTGSYARHETAEGSDIDVLVVSDNKFKLPRQDNIDFTVISLNTLVDSLKNNPIQYLPMLLDASPIINKQLLEQLKAIKINLRKLAWFLETTKNRLKTIESLIEYDKAKNLKISKNPGSIYSLVLRLRGIYIIECLLQNKRYSNSGFKKKLIEKGIDKALLDRFYKIYKAERDDKKEKTAVLLEEIIRLYNITKAELESLEVSLHAKLKETAKERS